MVAIVIGCMMTGRMVFLLALIVFERVSVCPFFSQIKKKKSHMKCGINEDAVTMCISRENWADFVRKIIKVESE